MQVAWLTSWVVGLLLTAGCEMEHRVVRDDWETFRGQMPTDEASGPNVASSERQRGPYAVLLGRFTGPDRHVDTFQLLRKVREQTQLEPVWSADGGNVAAVYAGRFDDPRDPAAQRLVDQVRQAQLDGSQPFADASLSAISGQLIDSAPRGPLDLVGKEGQYTLQIGYYDERYGEGFRQAAEQAAQALRDDGEEAFFYHGPHRSMITIGLFTDRDFVSRNGVQSYGPQILEVQQRFPHHLGNGRTELVTVFGQDQGEQSTTLVRVPQR